MQPLLEYISDLRTSLLHGLLETPWATKNYWKVLLYPELKPVFLQLLYTVPVLSAGAISVHVIYLVHIMRL